MIELSEADIEISSTSHFGMKFGKNHEKKNNSKTCVFQHKTSCLNIGRKTSYHDNIFPCFVRF